MLTGNEILRRKEIGDIVIEPFNIEQLNPNSYNLTLNKKLLVYDGNNIFKGDEKWEPYLDSREDNKTKEIIIPEYGLKLQPNTLYLGSTNEYTETNNLVPGINGRSSIGRLGIFVHVTAGFGDIGFKGYWTLEILVVHPVIIYPDMKICQIFYDTADGDTSIQYRGKYQNNTGVEASKIYIDK
jgi:dCTP deaminase